MRIIHQASTRVPAALWLALPAVCLSPGAPADEGIDFNRDIRPILSNNCFACHGPDDKKRKANLRLDSRDEAIGEREGGHHAIAPGSVESSALIGRVTAADPGERMPPPETKKKLTQREISLLKSWIAGGAEYQPHWAFLPVKRPEWPKVKGRVWPRNGMDHFILYALEQANLTPSAEASRRTLIRRAYLDLIGLLPAPRRVDRFVQDERPDAFERVVDELLQSPHYGERWGRHWLDQARYADSDGYAIDGDRSIWPFRDWVIKALNEDMPFDQFTIEQLAGDFLSQPTRSQLVATGFHRNTLVNTEGGTDREQFRNEAVVDRVNTTGSVWLGLSVGCAQCHTHKFDPITHREYYQLFAFFNSGEDQNRHDPQISLPTEEDETELQRLDARIKEARQSLETAKEEKNSEEEIKAAEKAKKEWEDKKRKVNNRIPKTLIMRDLKEPRKSYIHIRGDFLRQGDEVRPNVPAVLGSLPDHGSGRPLNRLDLTRWLVDEKNPLTARVVVNRVWMRYFGRGLVETESDFGLQGTYPSHPELLDWLASEFMKGGWSMKKLHRLIATSTTYRQSSDVRTDLAAADPLNIFLGRQFRLRVESEIVRDLALSASGMLAPAIGGRSVYPPQPGGVYAFTQTKKSWKTSTGDARFRRGMYTFFYRSAPHPMLSNFDTPNFQAVCTRRERSNTPLQSLNLANDPAMIEIARGLARRVLSEDHGGGGAGIKRAFELCLSRPPTGEEAARLAVYFRQQQRAYQSDAESATAIAPSDLPAHIDPAAGAAWTALARVLLNLDEFITRG